MKQNKDDTSEAHHRLGFVRSDFDTKMKGCVLKTTSKRFQGPNAYVKTKDYDAGLGMSHGKFESKQKGAVAMKREKHSRFSVYGNIYDSIKINDVAPVSPPRLEEDVSDDKPSVMFRKSKKEKGRDAWMKTKKEDNEADHHFVETRSDFDMSKTNKSAVKMSRRIPPIQPRLPPTPSLGTLPPTSKFADKKQSRDCGCLSVGCGDVF